MTSTDARLAPSWSSRSTPVDAVDRRSALPRLAVVGGTGRLGSAVVRGAQAAGFPVVSIVGAPGRPRSHLSSLGGSEPSTIPVLPASELREALADADVVVSASTPAAEEQNLAVWTDAGVPAVIATTGLGDRAQAALRSAAQQVPLVVDANFSLGVQLLIRLTQNLGVLPEGFDLSITETHRRGKNDHPSGTAQAIARSLAPSGAQGWQEARGSREPGVVEIASLRGGDVPGQHTVWISGPHEVVRVEHWAFGREAFVDGILAAARWLAPAQGRGPRPGLYSLQDVLAPGPGEEA